MFAISIATRVATERADQIKREKVDAKAAVLYEERLEEAIDAQIGEASREGKFVAKIYVNTREYDFAHTRPPEWLKSLLDRYQAAGYEIGPVTSEFREAWYLVLLVHYGKMINR